MNFDIFKLAKPFLAGALRHAAGGWAIWLIHRGYLANDGVDQFTGAVMFLGAIGFSMLDKVAATAIQGEISGLSAKVSSLISNASGSAP